jgi:adenosine deaminase
LKRILSVFFSLLISLSTAVAQTRPGAEQRAAKYLESVRHEPLLLGAFVEQMPKGGDLHNHLSGAAYAESYIQFAANDGLCVDRSSLTLLAAPCDETRNQISAARALQDAILYRELINAFSMRDFSPGSQSGHDHFFDAFGKFRLASRAHPAEMIAEVASRAAAQNESYLELILNADRGAAAELGKALRWDDDFDRMRQALLAAGLRESMSSAVKFLDDVDADSKKIMCSGAPRMPGCGLEVRYIYEVYRGLPREQVFAMALAGFEMAMADPRLVAVNPVMPEDGYTSMRDYALHMRIFDYLHKLYPKVHITLHAGELAPGLVPPDGLNFHIRQAVEVGHAERIGHGADVMHEDRPFDLLKEMARKKVAVEICLTSNDLILGVKDREHPLPQYLKAGVPVAIATDDEGVSRSDMTREYQRAIETYGLSYAQVKQIVRNSIRYSFADTATRDRLMKDLEQRFSKFETPF